MNMAQNPRRPMERANTPQTSMPPPSTPLKDRALKNRLKNTALKNTQPTSMPQKTTAKPAIRNRPRPRKSAGKTAIEKRSAEKPAHAGDHKSDRLDKSDKSHRDSEKSATDKSERGDAKKSAAAKHTDGKPAAHQTLRRQVGRLEASRGRQAAARGRKTQIGQQAALQTQAALSGLAANLPANRGSIGFAPTPSQPFSLPLRTK